MALTEYKRKRHFDDTPEPTGGNAHAGKLHFVVQKHAASHLHYDFRLEMQGVLKSWAVPKGPSLDPDVKRLAMMVEDHPYNYRTFEGIIPEGNYGAGTVIIWDEGTYEPEEGTSTDKKKQEKSLLHQLNQGALKIILHGKKLKGSFALVKTSGYHENSWLLMKHRDKYASQNDITEKAHSVKSDLTVEEVATKSKSVWHSNRAAKIKKKATPKATASAGKKKALKK
ncbi:MAG: DNA polymerase ligase N-terminal domain-containing protein [Parafilimonas sp.]